MASVIIVLYLHELSAEDAESEKSSILDTSGELEFRKYLLSQSSEPDSDVDSPNVCGNCMTLTYVTARSIAPVPVHCFSITFIILI